MESFRYCRVCHLVVAPGDPNRLEHRGALAHEACLKRSSFAAVREEAEEVLALAGDPAIVENFRAGLGRCGRLPQFAKMLSWQLGRAAKACSNGRSGRRQAIVAFAAKASEAILCEVTVDAVRSVAGDAAARSAT